MANIIRIGDVAMILNQGSTLTKPEVDINALIDQIAMADK